MLNFGLVCLDPSLVKSHFKGFTLLFDFFDLSVFTDFTTKLLESLFDGFEDLVHLLLLRAALGEYGLHLFHSRIEGLSSSHFFKHLKETFLAFSNQGLNLTLLNDLELRLTLKRKTSSFKQIEQLLLLDWDPVDLIGVTVRVRVIGLLHLEFCALDSHSLIRIVENHFDRVIFGVSFVLT